MRKILASLLLFVLIFAAVTPTFAAEGQTPSGILFSELESQIDALVAEHLGVTTLGVAIAVVSRGEIIFMRGWGYADVERGIPVDPAETAFLHGSIGKTFVWVAAMQLAEQGLLDLDEDINRYLSEEDRRLFAFEMPFTMRDLMNHTAGFEDVAHNFVSIESPNWSTFSLRDALLANQPKQIFAPNTAMAYSNWGTTLASYIVEEISGQDFAAFELENIFVPANMTSTLNAPFWSGNEEFIQRRARGHTYIGSGDFREFPDFYFTLYPAGSTQGTVEDFTNYIKALTPQHGESGSLFESPDTLARLLSSSSIDPINRPTTYHGFLRYDGIMPAIGHGGDVAGAFSANFAVVPEERFGWVVFANAGGEMDIRFGLTDLLIGNTMDQVQPLSGNLPNAEAFSGHFVPIRRVDSNLFEFSSYLALYRVTAIDENTIQLSFAIGSATYLQVEPYVFRIISSDNHIFNSMFSELRFVMEDGRPVQVFTGIMDLTALPPGRTMPFLIAYASIAVISFVFFLLMPIVLLVTFIINKKRGKTIEKTRFRLLRLGLLISGTVIVLNNTIATLSGMITGIFTSAGLNPHIIANYIFVGLSAVLFVVSIFFLRKEANDISTKSKVLYSVTVTLLALFIILLWNWNFFVLL